MTTPAISVLEKLQVALLASGFGFACGIGCAVVSRELAPYRAGVEFHYTAHLDSYPPIEELARIKLSEGDREECKRLALISLTLQYRARWHRDIELHLANPSEWPFPGEEPSVPTTDTICGGTNRDE